jgi:hypothetical protein
MSEGKIPRSLADLVGALGRHVKLLREYAVKAFDERNNAYLGEVAGKLRLLVGERAGNDPLLLRVMKALDIKVPIVLGGPPTIRPPGEFGAGDTVSLRQYLGMVAYGTWTPTNPWVEVTNGEVIHIWAQQHGAAHEDWELDEAFIVARDSGLFIGGRQELAAVLISITRTVIYVSERTLVQITPERIAEAEARRKRPT